jgi:hypothetical protein
VSLKPDREALPPLGASARCTNGRSSCGRWTANATANAAIPRRAANPAPHQKAVRLRVTGWEFPFTASIRIAKIDGNRISPETSKRCLIMK